MVPQTYYQGIKINIRICHDKFNYTNNYNGVEENSKPL